MNLKGAITTAQAGHCDSRDVQCSITDDVRTQLRFARIESNGHVVRAYRLNRSGSATEFRCSKGKICPNPVRGGARAQDSAAIAAPDACRPFSLFVSVI